jgi:antitoxin YokJ
MNMRILTELLDRIARDPDCVIVPAVGQPAVDTSHAMPEDVRMFYGLCGGLVIGRRSFYQARIVAPSEVLLASDIILGEFAAVARVDEPEDPSWNWYIIAEVENSNHLSIDFGPTHKGRCYDSFWDIYGQVGNMPVIASSLTELLRRLYDHEGGHWYWLEPGFQALGDAYDAT